MQLISNTEVLLFSYFQSLKLKIDSTSHHLGLQEVQNITIIVFNLKEKKKKKKKPEIVKLLSMHIRVQTTHKPVHIYGCLFNDSKKVSIRFSEDLTLSVAACSITAQPRSRLSLVTSCTACSRSSLAIVKP